MHHDTYRKFTGGIFAIIAVLHLLRVVNSWPAQIASFTVPMWLSWVALLLAGYLAYSGLKRN